MCPKSNFYVIILKVPHYSKPFSFNAKSQKMVFECFVKLFVSIDLVVYHGSSMVMESRFEPQIMRQVDICDLYKGTCTNNSYFTSEFGLKKTQKYFLKSWYTMTNQRTMTQDEKYA